MAYLLFLSSMGSAGKGIPFIALFLSTLATDPCLLQVEASKWDKDSTQK